MTQRVPNPYRPGFNQAPAVLAGRDQVLRDAREAIETAALDYRTPRPLILVGPRGVGKTVTLGEIANTALAARSWTSVRVEGAPGTSLVDDLTVRLEHARELLGGQDPSTKRPSPRTRVTGGKVSASMLGVGGEVQVTRGAAPGAGRLDEVLERVMTAAMARDSGLVVTLDELHTAPVGEVGQVAAVLQSAVPRDWPLVVVAAALPSIRVARGPRKLPTYLERAEWHELGPLNDEDAFLALTGPALEAGRPMSDRAARLLLDVAGGYPYAVQVAGHFTWRESHGTAKISVAHAEKALPRILEDLAQLFVSRWADASAKEREYLTQLARLDADGSVRGGEIAAALGKDSSQVSYLRDRLIRKGTIYPGPDGSLHFITPGMGRWIRDQEGHSSR